MGHNEEKQYSHLVETVKQCKMKVCESKIYIFFKKVVCKSKKKKKKRLPKLCAKATYPDKEVQTISNRW